MSAIKSRGKHGKDKVNTNTEIRFQFDYDMYG